MRLIHVTNLILSALLLNFVSLCSTTNNSRIDQTVQEDDNGKAINLASGDTLTVRLRAQLGAGYGWYVTSGPGEHLEQPDKHPKIESDKGAPGGSDIEVFRFVARRAGNVRLEFRYGRPRDQETLKTFHVTIVIK